MSKRNMLDKIYSYTEGNSRYFLYRVPVLDTIIPKHIREQFEIRKESADLVCSLIGKCKECGCKTPALHFADQSCEGLCYPDFLSKEDFDKLKKGEVVRSNGVNWILEEGRFSYKYYEQH